MPKIKIDTCTITKMDLLAECPECHETMCGNFDIEEKDTIFKCVNCHKKIKISNKKFETEYSIKD